MFEGFGLSLIEARSQGCALISTKTNGGKKLIDDHENGLLVNINDENDLAEKIELLITDKNLRNKLISNGYLVAANYNIEKIAENWKDIL